MPAAAELEIFVVCSQRVAVEHDRCIAAIARHAAVHFMLSALAEFPEIGEGSVRRGYAGIVFLDAAAHFRNQLLLQAVGMAEQALGIVVLFFQIAADVWSEDRGIAQHFLPFRVLQPRIVVRDRDAVGGEGMRPARCNRRGRWLCGSFWLGHSILIRYRDIGLRYIGTIGPIASRMTRVK